MHAQTRQGAAPAVPGPGPPQHHRRRFPLPIPQRPSPSSAHHQGATGSHNADGCLPVRNLAGHHRGSWLRTVTGRFPGNGRPSTGNPLSATTGADEPHARPKHRRPTGQKCQVGWAEATALDMSWTARRLAATDRPQLADQHTWTKASLARRTDPLSRPAGSEWSRRHCRRAGLGHSIRRHRCRRRAQTHNGNLLDLRRRGAEHPMQVDRQLSMPSVVPPDRQPQKVLIERRLIG